ncbi:hypothetical protein WMY93_023281 [Mugilogobius chulae]|uniref:FAM194 C-terminal domain-containing protein n=1 Tax=Mugilogobius chulae TaxID=88201 RepID=A0AAW0N8R9_9GOBI
MTTSTGPVYFFDQPTKQRGKTKGRRSNLDLKKDTTGEVSQTLNKDQSELPQLLSGETQKEDGPEISSSVFSLKEQDVMEAYKHRAPQLLSELAHVLSEHNWSDEGRLPHGLVNILHYTWQELTAGAQQLPASQHTERSKSRPSSNIDLPQRQQPLPTSSKPERALPKPGVGTGGRVKKRKSRSRQDRCATSLSSPFSTRAILTKTASYPNIRVSSQPNRSLLLRHYGDPKPKKTDKSKNSKSRLGALVTGFPPLPVIPEILPPDSRKKLHYRINDGSSTIYYSSGSVAVCQSRCSQPPGGFCSNVFSDSSPPVIIATITALGHGTVIHPRSSSAISAAWDQHGGLVFDQRGQVTKEWSWTKEFSKKIAIEISDKISLNLISGTSAILDFKCNNELVQLPVTALPRSNTADKMPFLHTNANFCSDTAYDLVYNPPAIVRTDNNLTMSDVPMRLRRLDRPGDNESVWRKEGRALRELRKIQMRVQHILQSWMDFYCIAIGIKCPDKLRMPDVPPRSRLKGEVQSAALPSLNLPETHPGPVPPPQGKEEGLRRYLSSAPTPRPKNRESPGNLVRSPKKKRSKEEKNPITLIGSVQYQGNIKTDRILLPVDPDDQPACVPYPADLLPSLSSALTHCPVLLRAA